MPIPRNARRLLIPPAILVGICLYSARAEACTCMSSGPPCQNLFVSDVVFVGTARSITDSPSEGPDGRPFERRFVTFSIERAVRGIEGTTVDVRTGLSGADCGFDFKAGARYVVYASRHPDGTLRTGICSRTRLAADAAEDLAYFAALPATGDGARLFGTVKHWERDYASEKTVEYGDVPDVQVLIRGPRGVFSAMTGAAGKYAISGIAPGSYEVDLLPPAGFSTRNHQRKIQFTDPRACRAEEFSLHYDGRIRGTLLDQAGLAVAGVRIDIVSAARPNAPFSLSIPSQISDDSGRFELVDIPPGQYLLGVGLRPRYDDGHVYPATFHAGASRAEEAKPIDVGPAEHVQLEPLRVPAALVRRTVTGTVTLPDGAPVSGASVVLRGSRGTQASTVVSTNQRGEFSVRAFEGLTYTVHSHYNLPGDTQRRQLQATQVITIAGPPQPVRLVLTPMP